MSICLAEMCGEWRDLWLDAGSSLGQIVKKHRQTDSRWKCLTTDGMEAADVYLRYVAPLKQEKVQLT